MKNIDSKIPQGDLNTKWTKYKSSIPLVSPANKRRTETYSCGIRFSWSRTTVLNLGELGYNVHCFTFHDNPLSIRTVSLRKVVSMLQKYYQGGGGPGAGLNHDTIKENDYMGP